MIVFVRYNRGPGVSVDLQSTSQVLDLRRLVASQQEVPAEQLRVLFNGRELEAAATLESCNVPEQSTIHVVLSSAGSGCPPSHQGKVLQRRGSAGAGGSTHEGREGSRRSFFFVFCKSCASVQPGKLRVRCRRCRDATLEVTRDPTCWDDILLPGRISGICQSNGCQGDEAEFYMKCASHPTSEDELSVILNLIRTNIRDVPCIACTDIMDVVLVFSCRQGHVLCLECFRGYCQTRLDERQFVSHPVIGYSLPCAAGCEESLIQELHHFRVLGEEQYGRYQRFGAEQCLLAMGGVMCPSPGCGAGLVPPEGGRRVECERPLGCGLVFCGDCRGAFHQGACPATPAPPPEDLSQGSAPDEEAAARGRWDRASLLFIQGATKRCPRCSVPVERNGGCMHMRCPLCRADWCWLCGVAWNNDCRADHWFG